MNLSAVAQSNNASTHATTLGNLIWARHPPSGAPVHAISPGQEPFVDQVAAQRGIVGIEHLQREVDLTFLITNPGLELERQSLEYQESLRAIRRQTRQAPTGEESSEHDRLLPWNPTPDTRHPIRARLQPGNFGHRGSGSTSRKHRPAISRSSFAAI